MAKLTLQQKFLKALTEVKGETIVKELSGCVVLTRTQSVTGGAVPAKSYWFIGSNGSVRFGDSRTNSRPLRADMKALLLSWGSRDAIDSIIEKGAQQ